MYSVKYSIQQLDTQEEQRLGCGGGAVVDMWGNTRLLLRGNVERYKVSQNRVGVSHG